MTGQTQCSLVHTQNHGGVFTTAKAASAALIADAATKALLAKLKLLSLLSQCETAVQHLRAQARATQRVMEKG